MSTIAFCRFCSLRFRFSLSNPESRERLFFSCWKTLFSRLSVACSTKASLCWWSFISSEWYGSGLNQIFLVVSCGFNIPLAHVACDSTSRPGQGLVWTTLKSFMTAPLKLLPPTKLLSSFPIFSKICIDLFSAIHHTVLQTYNQGMYHFHDWDNLNFSSHNFLNTFIINLTHLRYSIARSCFLHVPKRFLGLSFSGSCVGVCGGTSDGGSGETCVVNLAFKIYFK